MKKQLLAIVITLTSLTSFAGKLSISADQINFENKNISCSFGQSWKESSGLYLEFLESFPSEAQYEKRSFSCSGKKCRNEKTVLYTACHKEQTAQNTTAFLCDLGGQFKNLKIDLSTAVVNDNEYNDNIGAKIEMAAELTEDRKILKDVVLQAVCKIDQ